MKTILVCAAMSCALTAVTPALAQNVGETAFKSRCAACHSVTPGEKRAGPNLSGVIGRKAGTTPGFAYSPSMAKSKIIWNTVTLDRYLADPRKAMPGTRMPIAVPDATIRSRIITYLRTQ